MHTFQINVVIHFFTVKTKIAQQAKQIYQYKKTQELKHWKKSAFCWFALHNIMKTAVKCGSTGALGVTQPPHFILSPSTGFELGIT